MPRLARLETPGLLHHIIILGIERRAIFRKDVIYSKGRRKIQVAARSLLGCWAVREL
ncbi:MAG: hypothetical protein KJP23_22275 [Deltaproteobacteria bacterium]|nr:hypothetical protein [Deltaproteobacteria bacterium]